MSVYFKLFFIFTMCLLTIYSSNLIASKYPKIINKNNGEILITKLIPPNEKIIRVEINISDDTSINYFDIIEVSFNDQKIDLLAPDLAGFRGRAYFQVKPGVYSIKWTISTNKKAISPHNQTFQKTITINDINPYVFISITGNKITVNQATL